MFYSGCHVRLTVLQIRVNIYKVLPIRSASTGHHLSIRKPPKVLTDCTDKYDCNKLSNFTTTLRQIIKSVLKAQQYIAFVTIPPNSH